MTISNEKQSIAPSTEPERRIHDRLPYVLIEKIIFDARYLLVIGYTGMTIAFASFVIYTVRQNIRIAFDMWHGTTSDVTVGILEGLDDIMIGNVIYLIVAGSYLVYVKQRVDDATFLNHQQRPQALQHLSPGSLKEKMAASLVGVTSVHLVQVLIETDPSGVGASWYSLTAIVGIHLALIIGMLAFWQANRGDEPHEILGSNHVSDVHDHNRNEES